MAQKELGKDVDDLFHDLMRQAPTVRKLFYNMHLQETTEFLQRLPREQYHDSEHQVFITLLLNTL